MKYKKKYEGEKWISPITVPKLFETPEFQNGMFFLH